MAKKIEIQKIIVAKSKDIKTTDDAKKIVSKDLKGKEYLSRERDECFTFKFAGEKAFASLEAVKGEIDGVVYVQGEKLDVEESTTVDATK